MVTLNKIYTRTGDDGTTGLATGQRVSKWHTRVDAYGSIDETNAALGLARLHTGEDKELDAMLMRIQNDLFDLGADLATPETNPPPSWEALRILPDQVQRLEREIDAMNAAIPPLDSFVLPGGSPLAAYLHLARTISRRAERQIALLASTPGEIVSEHALAFANRLSDFLFVASRRANANGSADVKWVPGANR
ncbi:MAG: cob(I)yrinic acid a,c-diamide adenosyltransferase [Alphaproteobacteria bacterium]|nr:cob(I)yrinic acid a,c-diamide adenosyltransferase [Alphaproteobacteria bacterium]